MLQHCLGTAEGHAHPTAAAAAALTRLGQGGDQARGRGLIQDLLLERGVHRSQALRVRRGGAPQEAVALQDARLLVPQACLRVCVAGSG